MICLTILYPNGPNATFNLDYYLNTHTPMAVNRMTPLGLKRMEILSGSASLDGTAAPYAAICNLFFETMESMQTTLTTVGAELAADIPNYCTVPPTFQIGGVAATYPNPV